MATILLVGVDLFFRGKLEGLLPAHHLVTSDSADPPDLVICDIARIDPDDVADAWPDVPILGYTNHTDKAGLQRGDVISDVRDAEVDSLADFYRKVWTIGDAGAEVPMRIVRDGRESWLRVKSADRNSFLKRPQLQ